MTTDGTPQTLLDAISNGMADGMDRRDQSIEETIRSHVRDFLAQRFGAAICAAEIEGEHNTVEAISMLFQGILKASERDFPHTNEMIDTILALCDEIIVLSDSTNVPQSGTNIAAMKAMVIVQRARGGLAETVPRRTIKPEVSK